MRFIIARVLVRDRPTAAAKDRDVVGAVFAQLPDYVGEKLDVPAVVTGDADGRHVLLDGGADNVARRNDDNPR